MGIDIAMRTLIYIIAAVLAVTAIIIYASSIGFSVEGGFLTYITRLWLEVNKPVI